MFWDQYYKDHLFLVWMRFKNYGKRNDKHTILYFYLQNADGSRPSTPQPFAVTFASIVDTLCLVF